MEDSVYLFTDPWMVDVFSMDPIRSTQKDSKKELRNGILGGSYLLSESPGKKTFTPLKMNGWNLEMELWLR